MIMKRLYTIRNGIIHTSKTLEECILSKKSLFQCPVCSSALVEGERQYFCRKGHSFDIARKGYVNLLLPSHIGAGDPGDPKEMIECRRDFLNKGYYENFSDHLNEALISQVSDIDKTKEISILDAGCGEGYYTSRLRNRLLGMDDTKAASMYGIDVSKAAIHYASGRDKNIRFAVASTYHTPILSNSMDAILCIFAPRDEQEFTRILKPSGKLIVAAPGAQHLLGFKKALYEESDVIGQKGTVGEGFELLKNMNVSYDIHLKVAEDIFNLLMMTPYSRHTNQEAVEDLKKLNELDTEVDFNIMIYQKV
jgi:23S rRNA (guanine745-N1)-methyltransferase